MANQATGTPAGEAQRAAGRAKEEAREAKRLAGDAREEIKEKGAEAGDWLKHEAEERGEEYKEQAANGLQSFADAVRAAGDQLRREQPGPAGDMVGQAASGLEALSRGLHRRSTGEMLDSLRDFGRRNPAGFIAGSVLAGFAVGRFAGSSSRPKGDPYNNPFGEGTARAPVKRDGGDT